MNTRQRERVEDLGRALTQAVGDIVEMGQDPIITERLSGPDQIPTAQYAYREEVGREEMTAMTEPMPTNAAPGMQNDRLAPYHVNIRNVHNGFIVEVGCQTFVFEKFAKLAEYLDMYYRNPTEAIRKHDEGKLF